MTETIKPLVRFHALGDLQSGLGHVIRCATLANAMIHDFAVEFDCASLSHDVRTLLRQYCSHEVQLNDAANSPMVQSEQYPPIEIFDGYTFDPDVFARAKDDGSMVVRIDDRAGDYSHCDMVICHGPHAKPEMFKVDTSCRVLLGPKYALINRCFYAANAAPGESIKRLFVSLGGGDSGPFLAQVAGDVLGLNGEIEIHVAHIYANAPQALQALSLQKNVKLHAHLTHEEMADMMAKCDAAITAGGGTSIEAAAVGLPVLLVAIAENQIAPCEEMQRLGIAAYGGKLFGEEAAGHVEFTRGLERFFSDAAGRKKLTQACQKIFKNSGADLVAEEIMKRHMTRIQAG